MDNVKRCCVLWKVMMIQAQKKRDQSKPISLILHRENWKNELVYQIWLNLMVKRYHIEIREASFWKVIRSNGQNSLGHFLVHVTSKWAFLVLGGCKCLTGWLVHFLSQLGNVKKTSMAWHVMAHRQPNLYYLMKKSPLFYHQKSCLHSVVLKKL